MDAEFHTRLIDARDKRHSKNHPYFEMWARGNLTKEQTAIYCVQHYHYVREYLNWMAYEASQVPYRDVRSYLLENLQEEEDPEDRHLDMLVDYVVACGLPRESVENGTVLPGTEDLQNWGWRLRQGRERGDGTTAAHHRRCRTRHAGLHGSRAGRS